MHDDIRQVGQHLEMFRDGQQISVGGDLVATTAEEIAAIRDALYEETSFGEKYEFSEKNFKILGKVCQKLNRFNQLPNAFTKSRIFSAYAVLDAAGGMSEFGTLERVAAEPAATAVARTNDGRFATEHDLLRQEVRRLLSDPSVSAQSIRQKADRDRAFGDAFRAELAPVPAAQPALSHEEQAQENVTGELDSFVQSWKRIANPRFIGGYLQLDEHTRLTPIELDQWLNRATAAGLI